MPTVLFVDDDTALRTQLRTIFEMGSGFDACVEARNGVEALATVKRQSPNLAVLDFSLPDIDGIDLARKLKAMIPELPIFVMMTDYSMSVEKKALSSGISAVFSKLDDLATLLANARAVCGIE